VMKILRGCLAWIVTFSPLGWAQDGTGQGESGEDRAEVLAVNPQGIEGLIETRQGRRFDGRVSFFRDSLRIEKAGSGVSSLALSEVAMVTMVAESGQETRSDDPGAEGGLPAPWRNRDLGRTLVPGKVRWRDGVFRILASPRAGDERFASFHLVYLPVEGDCEIQARVLSLGNEDDESYAGIVICDGTTPENRKAVLGLHPHGEKRVNFRRWGYQGGSVTGKELPSLKLPYWLKLVREGYDVTAYHSPDGRRWRMLKVSAGRMRDKKAFVGLAVQMGKDNRLSEALIDSVSINGEGSAKADPMLPQIVLRGGSRLAAEIREGNRSAFQLGGRWDGRAITAPSVARLEFFHPLPPEAELLVEGDRNGLLLRSGDFSEGAFEALGGGEIRLGSILFGSRKYSILDEVDCLVLRGVAPEPARYRVETWPGSILLAQQALLQGEKLLLRVSGLGEVGLELQDLKSLQALK